MRSYIQIAGGIAICLMAAAPAFAQSSPNAAKPNEQTAQQQQNGNGASGNTFDTSTGATKQRTQGLPAGTLPPQYGSDWSRRQQPAKTQ